MILSLLHKNNNFVALPATPLIISNSNETKRKKLNKSMFVTTTFYFNAPILLLFFRCDERRWKVDEKSVSRAQCVSLVALWVIFNFGDECANSWTNVKWAFVTPFHDKAKCAVILNYDNFASERVECFSVLKMRLKPKTVFHFRRIIRRNELSKYWSS